MVRGVIGRAVVVPFTSVLPAVKAALFRVFKRSELSSVASSRVAQKIISGAALSTTSEPLKPVAINPTEDVAVLQYTGGTTGTPKGAMLTHANLTANTAQVVAWALNLKSGEESILGALPLFHVFAMTVVMNVGIAKAAKIILMPRFQLVEALKLIHREKPTMMPVVPTILTAMLHHPEIKSFDLSSLRFCLSGGAPLPVEVKLKIRSSIRCISHRRLRLVGGLAGTDRQSGRGRTDLRARSACRSPPPSFRSATSTIRRGKSRKASAASCAPRGRKS